MARILRPGKVSVPNPAIKAPFDLFSNPELSPCERVAHKVRVDSPPELTLKSLV